MPLIPGLERHRYKACESEATESSLYNEFQDSPGHIKGPCLRYKKLLKRTSGAPITSALPHLCPRSFPPGKSKDSKTEKESELTSKEKKPGTKRTHQERNVEMAAELSQRDVTNSKEVGGTSGRALLCSSSASEASLISPESDVLESQVALDERLSSIQATGVTSNMESEGERSPEDPSKVWAGVPSRRVLPSPGRTANERNVPTWRGF